MKKSIIKSVALFLIILISIFVGYENPELIESTKSIFKAEEKTFEIDEEKIEEIDTDSEEKEFHIEAEIKANSFSLKLLKVKTLPDQSASLFISKNTNGEEKFKFFTQDGFLILENNKVKINLPSSYYDKNIDSFYPSSLQGGVKSVILVNDEYFALISSKKDDCKYASLISLKNKKEILKSECLPDSGKIDFAGLGSAYLILEENLLLSIGAPENSSQVISELAQNKDSIFGKILNIEINSLSSKDDANIKYNFFSIGHRNPQGLALLEGDIFSLEHGPQGGDELNKILKGKNYGWPVVSYGTKYNYGKSYSTDHTQSNFQAPIYFFNPAIAPSSLSKCPKNLSDYYKNNNCLMGLSLAGQSILIFLLDKENNKVLSVEKIFIGKRLRHFGVKESGDLFLSNENYFYITADRDGVYKVKFDKFR
tara:strand:+ start:1292 stop:2566 length:1275 start_codon:yes stop_codon:yes gene_type:complete